MGKIRIARRRYHSVPAKTTTISSEFNSRTQSRPRSHHIHPSSSGFIGSNSSSILANPSHGKLSRNVFSNVNISPDMLKQELSEFDKQSMISSSSTIKQLSKKEKKLLKHDWFLNKLNLGSTSDVRKGKTEKKISPGFKDMTSLADALPTLEVLLKEVEKPELKEKPRAGKSFKQQQQAMLQDIQIFHQVLSHPSFMADPAGTIATHLQSSLQSENH